MKRRFLRAFAAAAGVFFAFFGCETDENGDDPLVIDDKVYDSPVIVCFGDSLTEGYGAGTGTEPPDIIDRTKSYPVFLEKKVKAHVENAGISGDKTADGLARVDEDVLKYDPQVVVIELGANDFLPVFLETSGSALAVSLTESNLEAIIDKCYEGEAGANRKVYLAKFYTDAVFTDLKTLLPLAAVVGNNPLADLNVEQIAEKLAIMEDIKPKYDKMYTDIAAKYADKGFEIIEDIWTGIWGLTSSLLSADHVHPTAAGYEIQADLYFKAMKPYLQAQNLVRSGVE